MANKIRECVVCKKNYQYCPHCSGEPNETWRMIYCSSECKDIYAIFNEYRAKKINALDAKELLSAYTIPETFQDYMIPAMNEIMAAEKPVRKGSKKIVEEEKSEILNEVLPTEEEE